MLYDHEAGGIRAMRVDDLPALKTVIDGVGLFPSGMLDEMTAAVFGGTGGDEFWLTLEAPGPVGIAYCAPERLTSGTWNLLLIAVDPARQGEGLGSKLMRHVEAMLARRGERILLVETSGVPEFERTRGFYAHLGYAEEARIRDYYQAGDDKVVFRKALQG